MGENRAQENGKASIKAIVKMMGALEMAEEEGEAMLDGESMPYDDIEQYILKDQLSVCVRTNWYAPNRACPEPGEYQIFLSTGDGGLVTRIVGDLDEYGKPISAIMQCQAWSTEWENVSSSPDENKAMLAYASMFLSF